MAFLAAGFRLDHDEWPHAARLRAFFRLPGESERAEIGVVLGRGRLVRPFYRKRPKVLLVRSHFGEEEHCCGQKNESVATHFHQAHRTLVGEG